MEKGKKRSPKKGPKGERAGLNGQGDHLDDDVFVFTPLIRVFPKKHLNGPSGTRATLATILLTQQDTISDRVHKLKKIIP